MRLLSTVGLPADASFTALPLGGVPLACCHISAAFERFRAIGLNRACDPPEAAGTVPSAPAVGRSRLEASCERVVTGDGSVRHGDLSPPGDTQLLAQNVRMSLRRSRGNTEPLADFVVRATCGDQLDHLTLPLGDRREGFAECVFHGLDAKGPSAA